MKPLFCSLSFKVSLSYAVVNHIITTVYATGLFLTTLSFQKCTYACLCAVLQRMYLVTELCEGGDLKDLLQKKKHFSEEETRHIIKSLLEAIVYLHKKGETHKTQHIPPDIRQQILLMRLDRKSVV